MWILALVSLSFSGWMMAVLYGSVKEEKPSGWDDHMSTVWIACGSMSGIAVAVSTILKAIP